MVMLSIMSSSSNKVSSPRAIISPRNKTQFNNKWFSPTALISHFCVAIMAFHTGLLAGYNTTSSSNNSNNNPDPCPSIESSRITTTAGRDMMMEATAAQPDDRHHDLLPSSMSSFVMHMGRVSRNDFAKQIDVGVPVDASTNNNENVLLLYGPNSIPEKADISNDGTTIPLYANVTQAMAQCNSLKVILTEPDTMNSCIAIMGQWESYHVHRMMRLPQPGIDIGPDGKIIEKFKARKHAINAKYPLRYVSRTHKDDGIATSIPNYNDSIKYYKVLTEYLVGLPDSLERLRPIAAKVANDNDGNGDVNGAQQQKSRPIVVLVCNFGQSELLMNFVCSARARNLDLSQVLLFATDLETTRLGQSLGLSVFEVGNAFGDLPKGSAKRYGDAIFSGMMMSKVYCVHMISSLGYDLLFQDVDVVWYRNPTTYFQNTTLSGDFDIYFQDDGAHSARYRPYSPNSGFYYVRHNERTEYFFSVFARMGDLIQKSGSHQSAMNALLSEHASWRGLRIKVFGREMVESDLFPGGFHFHKRRDFMKQLVQGEFSTTSNNNNNNNNDGTSSSLAPFIFHMSWTTNKENKVKFFQQLGDWYTQDVCIQQTDAAKGEDVQQEQFLSKCCSAEPIVVCHYSDKPSKIPCTKSPRIDKKGSKPFW